MFCLHRRSRAVVLACGLVCIVTSLATMPIGARSADALAEPATPPVALTPRPASPFIPAHRDPFDTDFPPPVARVEPPPAFFPAIPPPAATGVRDGIVALPPNLPGAPIPNLPPLAGRPQPTERVAAVVTGAHPYALLIDGAARRIAGIGDAAGGGHIIAIDLDGLRLDTGDRLAVAGGESIAAPR